MNFFEAIEALADSIKNNAHLTLGVVLALCVIHFLNVLLKKRLCLLGIYPRALPGLLGIVFSPWIHADVRHLLFNIIPLFALMNLVLVNGVAIFYMVTAYIVLLSGLGVWLFGRKALHVGASGVIMGYWSYVLINAIEQRTAVTILVALIGIYYFGGLLLNLFPQDKRSSWEGHVFGFLAGIITYFII